MFMFLSGLFDDRKELSDQCPSGLFSPKIYMVYFLDDWLGSPFEPGYFTPISVSYQELFAMS